MKWIKWLKTILHTHSYAPFVTDRYVEGDKVIGKGIYMCECGEVSYPFRDVGDIFRNRNIK